MSPNSTSYKRRLNEINCICKVDAESLPSTNKKIKLTPNEQVIRNTNVQSYNNNNNNNNCFMSKTNDLNNGLEDKSTVNTNTLFIVNNYTNSPSFATNNSCAYEIFCKNNNYDPYDVVNRIYLAFL
jgi:hypothetical protein